MKTMNNSKKILLNWSRPIINFSSWIIRTTILFIGITFVIYLMRNRWRIFMKTIFFYISYSILFLCIFRSDCIYNRFFSYKWTVWCFYLFILASTVKLTGLNQTWVKKSLNKTCYMVAHFSVPYEKPHKQLLDYSTILLII